MSEDQCCYWPDYVQPPTILTRTFGLTKTHYPWVEGQALMDLRNTPRFTYVHKPDPLVTKSHHAKLQMPQPNTLHIYVSATLLEGNHIAIYQSTITKGCMRGHDRMQALSRAVYSTFQDSVCTYPLL
jgi:hypothetical protein